MKVSSLLAEAVDAVPSQPTVIAAHLGSLILALAENAVAKAPIGISAAGRDDLPPLIANAAQILRGRLPWFLGRKTFEAGVRSFTADLLADAPVPLPGPDARLLAHLLCAWAANPSVPNRRAEVQLESEGSGRLVIVVFNPPPAAGVAA